MAGSVRLDTLCGPLVLRRTRFGEDPPEFYSLRLGADLEYALNEALSSDPLAVCGLLDELGQAPVGVLGKRAEIVRILLDELRWGRLVLSEPHATSSSHEGVQQLFAAFAAFRAEFGQEFQMGSRQYRLVARESMDRVRSEKDFDVVPAREARSLIERLARRSRDPEVRGNVDVLVDNLVDLHSPQIASGYLLLSAPLVRAHRTVPTDEVLTPAKVKRLAEERTEAPWADVEVVFEDGTSYESVLSVQMADGTVHTWPVGASVTRFEPVADGPVEAWLDVAEMIQT